LVTGRDWSSGEEFVEVAHEALLRGWPKLDEWMRERRSALVTVRQLQQDTENWVAKKGRLEDYRWSHERAREARSDLTRLGAEVQLSFEERDVLGPIDPETMLLEIEQPTTSHQRRALIGDRLAVLGGPRAGVGVTGEGTPQVEWCPTDGGDVAILVRRKVLGGTKQHWRRVESFQIGRYPITAGQYRSFIEARDGWRDRNWWAPDLYRDPEGNSYDFGRYDNHPAVYVNWFDAMAFCRWLSQRLGREVRLPDEWEWQHAATGGDSNNVYPWGRVWDPKFEPYRANTFASRLGRITAVGMYPAGKVLMRRGLVSLSGGTDAAGGEPTVDHESSRPTPLDMSGTVWEWCLNKYDKPNVMNSRVDDFDARVLRGGSWFVDPDVARADYRHGHDPAFRFNFRGFRVLCVSPMPTGH
jgi:formylglycine-generating enzyme required for sulfatase activity